MRRSDDTDARSGHGGWIVPHAAAPRSLLNSRHPRPVDADSNVSDDGGQDRSGDDRVDKGHGVGKGHRVVIDHPGGDHGGGHGRGERKGRG